MEHFVLIKFNGGEKTVTLCELFHYDNLIAIFRMQEQYTFSVAPVGCHTWESATVDLAGAIDVAREQYGMFCTETMSIVVYKDQEILIEVKVDLESVK